MKTKEITPLEYAKYRGCSLANVTKQIRNNRSLPMVIKIKKWSRFYLLEVPANLDANSFVEITI